MSTALDSFLQLGYPRNVNDAGGRRVIYVYRGPTADLVADRPAFGDTWEGLDVQRTELASIDGSDYSDLTVETGTTDSEPAVLGSAEVTNNEYPAYSIEWAQFEKELKQHPQFADFTAENWQNVRDWEHETDSEQRALFKFYRRDADGETVGSVVTLGTSGVGSGASEQDYASLRLLGVDSFLDFTPVARKTYLYRGSQKPVSSDAGQKISGDPFADVPTGYEWILSADRVEKQGRGLDWVRSQEWTGARKVLLDKDELFI